MKSAFKLQSNQSDRSKRIIEDADAKLQQKPKPMSYRSVDYTSVVPEIRCPFCLTYDNWKIRDVDEGYDEFNLEMTLECRNQVELDLEPGEFEMCGCLKTVNVYVGARF